MNIALGALLIFILLFPGIIFRIAYLSVPYSRKTFKSSLIDELILSIIPALIIQITGLCILESITSFRFDIESFYKLLISSDENVDFTWIRNSLPGFVLYTIVINMIALILGYLTRKYVLKNKYDYKFQFLRVHNDWYYILTGKIIEFPNQKEEYKRIDTVWLDILATGSDGDVIYSGTLKEFILSKEEGIDRIYLSDVRRRKLKDDAGVDDDDTEVTEINIKENGTADTLEIDKRYYSMPGDYFVIPYSQIKNINIIYYNLEEIK
jgi:hypothetical protein